MQCQRQQTVARTKASRGEAAQVKWRTPGYNDLGKLLALSLEWRLFIDRVLRIRNIEQRCAKDLLIVFEVLWCVLNEQPVARLQDY